MNATTTGVMVRNTTSTSKFDNVTLTNNAIVVEYKKKESQGNFLFGTGEDL